jgi:hypothetical protein
MRNIVAAFLVMLAGIGGVRAQQSDACEVPGYLLFGDSLSERVTTAVAKDHALKIVVIGTTSSTLPGSDGARDAYPARLEAALRSLLPSVSIDVVAYAKPRQTAEKTVKTFGKILLEEKPKLVIWQTGTFDAMQGVDPKEFLASLTDGIEKLQNRGADVILVNMQYSPRTESVFAIGAYDDNMRWVARERQVPLFDRLAIMRHWNDTGAIDLYAATKDISIAKRVHDCVGRALASLIIDAARLNASESKAPR